MSALVVTVFLASLVGSAHCVGMCGAFLAFAVGVDDRARARRFGPVAAYNAGRLVTYLALGVLAGFAGAAINLGGSLMGAQRAATIVAGSLMIGFGLIAFLRLAGVRIPRAPLPPALRRLAARGHQRAADLPPVLRAGAIGLLTTLLPCGWLYAFVITAAGTASPIRAPLVMGAFWLGTLPVMAALGLGIQSLTAAMRRRLPFATSAAIIIVGVVTVVGRIAAPAIAIPLDEAPGDTPAAIDRVNSLDSSRAPCCAGP